MSIVAKAACGAAIVLAAAKQALRGHGHQYCGS
jgi:hypothetical protein